MSQKIGKLLTCDRCGFTKFLPSDETLEFDDGFIEVNNFAGPEQSWKLCEDFSDCAEGRRFIVDLCPQCQKEYIKIKKDFFVKGRMNEVQII